jgi:tetratricopeptide (TPR) repeat protein
MLRSASVLPLLACVLLGVATSEAQTGRRTPPRSAQVYSNYSIEGTVRDATSNATLERVRVDLAADEGETLSSAYTDANGGFMFPNVRSGNYSLRVYEPGYATLQEPVDLRFGARRGLQLWLNKSGSDQPQLNKSGSDQPQPSSLSISAHELSMPTQAREAMDKGKKKLYGKKDPGGSLAHFERAVARAPNYYEAYYEMAVAQWQLGRLEEAEQNIRKSIETSGDKYAGADLGLGTLLADRKQFGEAEKFLHRAIELEPALWRGHYELGRTLMELNRLDEAQACAQQARTLRPDALLVYRLLERIHFLQKNNAALADDLTQYVKLDPNSPTGVRAKQILEELRQSPPQKQEPAATPPPKP